MSRQSLSHDGVTIFYATTSISSIDLNRLTISITYKQATTTNEIGEHINVIFPEQIGTKIITQRIAIARLSNSRLILTSACLIELPSDMD